VTPEPADELRLVRRDKVKRNKLIETGILAFLSNLKTYSG
jgi:hypothetical protein